MKDVMEVGVGFYSSDVVNFVLIMTGHEARRDWSRPSKRD